MVHISVHVVVLAIFVQAHVYRLYITRCMSGYIHTHIYIYMDTCVYIYIYVHAYTHMYINAGTSTYCSALSIHSDVCALSVSPCAFVHSFISYILNRDLFIAWGFFGGGCPQEGRRR